MTGSQLQLPFTTDAAEEFTSALAQVFAGGLRLAEWGQDMGIPNALGLSTEEWAQKKLKGYIHWDDEERRLVVKHLKEQLGLSSRKTAALIGVSHTTVLEDLRVGRNLPPQPDHVPGDSEPGGRNLPPPPKPLPLAEPVPCARCGTPTARLWVNEGDEFGGEVLCGACAAALAQVTADDLEELREYQSLRRRIEDRPRFAPVEAPSGTYAVLYADPPWRYEFPVSESRAVENHYPTMALEDIMALEVPAAPDCVLFLWATSPKLEEALQVVRAWDFTYRTSLVWVKEHIGLGYYARQQHEWLLVAVRGEPGTPAEVDRPASVISAPRPERHSQKPEVVYDLIERMYPGREKCELFARSPREGWAAWGNEVAACPRP